MSKPPKRFQKFTKDYPEIADAYEALGTAVHNNGPLDKKSRALVKLGISVGGKMQGAVHSHVRKALSAGVKPDELRHVALLALPTIGLPSMMAALSWIDETLEEESGKKKK
ncbi:MAG: carboxymuconolactone decarboxylase family protein [Ignavibacteriales bacterium]|nr:carboxymuconolactone decarboxylase family protein [Ignavibacteriales bacterium]